MLEKVDDSGSQGNRLQAAQCAIFNGTVKTQLRIRPRYLAVTRWMPGKSQHSMRGISLCGCKCLLAWVYEIDSASVLQIASQAHVC